MSSHDFGNEGTSPTVRAARCPAGGVPPARNLLLRPLEEKAAEKRGRMRGAKAEKSRLPRQSGEKMIRRSFISKLGQLAAASVSPSLLDAVPLPSKSKGLLRLEAQLSNGAGTFRFVKRGEGLGFELVTQTPQGSVRVASVANPVRIVYARRGNGAEKDVPFTSAVAAKHGTCDLDRIVRCPRQSLARETRSQQMEVRRVLLPIHLQTARGQGA